MIKVECNDKPIGTLRADPKYWETKKGKKQLAEIMDLFAKYNEIQKRKQSQNGTQVGGGSKT